MQITGKIKSHNFEFFLISIIIAALICFIFLIGIKFYDFTKFLTLDSFYYFKMSYNPFEGIVAPYTYRILTPFLVYILPFNHMTNFIIVNQTALITTSVLLYYYLKKLNFKPLYSFIGVLFFIFSSNVIYIMYNTALVDALSFLFFLLAFYAILCKNDRLYLLAIILGVVNKETILFTVPLYFLCKLNGENLGNAVKSTILIIIPAIILLIGIRFYFGFTDYLSLHTIKEILLYQINSNNILTNPYLTFGVLWIIGLYNLKINENKFLKNSLYILPFIFLQIFIATDTLRSLFIAFPIIIPLSLYLFEIKDNKILLSFLILSVITLLSNLTIFTFRSLLTSFMSFLILPSEILLTVILIILLIRDNPINIINKK